MKQFKNILGVQYILWWFTNQNIFIGQFKNSSFANLFTIIDSKSLKQQSL